MSILHLLILIPFLGAFATMLSGRNARSVALAVAGINLLLAAYAAIAYDHAASGYQFVREIPILGDMGLSFIVGADGLSLAMLLLASVVLLCAVLVAPRDLAQSPGLYYSCLLFIAAGAIGAFVSVDLFFLYAFHELALIPTFLMIGIWGSGDRQIAAWRITIYLAAGSFVLLIGLLGLYWSIPEGLRTFDLRAILALSQQGKLVPTHLDTVYLLILLGFGVLVSLFPFHSWAPQAYASAPVPVTMLHAGVLKKFGLYGLLRLIPVLPGPAQHFADLLLVLLLGNILYVGLATIYQKRLDLTLGYSSVMHMGYIFLGIATLSPIGQSGAALLMLGHGLSVTLLFALCGEISRQAESLEYARLGGLATKAPFLALAFGFATMASIGLPGLANFAGELLVFVGAFRVNFSAHHFSLYQWATIGALWGLVISAVYMLRAYRSVFFGELPSRLADSVANTSLSFRLPVLLLLALLLAIGCHPAVALDLIKSSLPLIAGLP